MPSALLSLILALSLFFSPAAFAKAKSKKKASQPHMNGVEAVIRAQESGESVELVDPDNPKKRILVEAPKDAKKKKEKEEPKEEPKTEQKAEDPQVALVPEVGGPAAAETQAVLQPPTIVIDAGHGGKDPGAQGTF